MFVANRVSTIVQCVGQANWFHVHTHKNPAEWPTLIVRTRVTPNSKKPIKVHFSFFKNFVDILDRVFNLSRAFLVLSYVYRFIHRTSPKFRSVFQHEIIPLT